MIIYKVFYGIMVWETCGRKCLIFLFVQKLEDNNAGLLYPKLSIDDSLHQLLKESVLNNMKYFKESENEDQLNTEIDTFSGPQKEKKNIRFLFCYFIYNLKLFFMSNLFIYFNVSTPSMNIYIM